MMIANMQSGGSAAAAAAKKLIPLLDRVLVERFVPEVKSKGGIFIPEKSVGKMHSGTVIAVGTGKRPDKTSSSSSSSSSNESPVVVQLKAGDKVLLPEYGGQKVEIEDKEYFLFRENEILAKWSE